MRPQYPAIAFCGRVLSVFCRTNAVAPPRFRRGDVQNKLGPYYAKPEQTLTIVDLGEEAFAPHQLLLGGVSRSEKLTRMVDGEPRG